MRLQQTKDVLRSRRGSRGGWIVLVLGIAGIVVLNILSAEPSHTEATTTPTGQAQVDVTAPQVESASTTAPSASPTASPEVKAPRKAVAAAKAANKAGKVTETPVSVAIPLPITIEPGTSPQPITITVNLKTPFTYTLHPGETSPVLYHTMTDGVQYPWSPGKNTYWQNEQSDPQLPVWSVIQLDAPSAAYVGNRIPFVVRAAITAQPGQYEAKIIVALRDNVHLGIPIAVTIIR